jgi:hypothetical protein
MERGRQGIEKKNTMRLLGKPGAGLLAGSAISASAAIVCSGNVAGTRTRVVIHEDNWRWGP